MSTQPTELYVHWSHRNFTAGKWREAAERFLELCRELNTELLRDDRVDHNTKEDFQECEHCARIHELQLFHDEFAARFANLWAIRALKDDTARDVLGVRSTQ